MSKLKESLSLSSRANNLFLVGILLAIFVAISAVLRIENIECVVDDQSDQNFCQQLDFLKGRSLFFTNFEATPLYQQILTNESGQVFMPVDVSRVLPKKIVIIFIREDPLYRLQINDQVFLVNSRHYLAEDTAQFDLPQVRVSEEYNSLLAQEKIDPEMSRQFYQLVDTLEQLSVRFDYIYFDKEESYVLVNEVKYLFSDQDDLYELAVKIYNILGDFSTVANAVTDGSTVTAIDMRFDSPLVIFD